MVFKSSFRPVALPTDAMFCPSASGVVHEGQFSLLERSSVLLGCDISNLADLLQHTNNIDGVVLLHTLKFLNRTEIEPHLRNVGLILCLFNNGIALERELIIVGKVGKLLLSQLYSARGRDIIDGAFLQLVVESIALVVETGGLDLTALIEQIDTEKFTLSSGLVPCLDVGFSGDSGLDSPLVCERRQTLDRVDVTTSVHGGS
ncbi:hypothetical protein HG531_007907 [Fusarium graminearum]|nr:hypothetical protein HG531_007907 [Fusarium graminearum]